MRTDYKNKIYAGWLGKIIGVRHGSNTEGWFYDDIKNTFGEITYFPFTYKNFAADDDINGPLFFMRALEDYNFDKDITAVQLGNTFLNYIADGKGFMWWGGYGVSTEHTAYNNLKSGIFAPLSGSIKLNGETIAQQIGGQIFSDCWGFIFPNEPYKAAEFAGKMASVTHDGDGVYGGMFISAAVSAAFESNNVSDIINTALTVIPCDSGYANIVKIVIEFYRKNPTNWRECFLFIKENYGYDKHRGACHIIPNAAVVVLSLLYGEGNFSKAINICNMCGWDTDCNIGNLGAIMGVMVDIEGIKMKWREPINDFVCASSVIGSLNIWDIPSVAEYTAYISDKMTGSVCQNSLDRLMHFEYKNSTHAFRADKNIILRNTDETSYCGNRSLKIAIISPEENRNYDVYYQTFYTNEDFNDSRYDPSFSSILYGGQRVECYSKSFTGQMVEACMYVECLNGKVIEGEKQELSALEWQKIELHIPHLEDETIAKCGIRLFPCKANQDRSTIVFIDNFRMFGEPDYKITFKNERYIEWWSSHKPISQFSINGGNWKLEEGNLHCNADKNGGAIYTGDYYFGNVLLKAKFIVKYGFRNSKFCLDFRVRGNLCGYYVAVYNGKVGLYKKEFDKTLMLCEQLFDLQYDRTYEISVQCMDDSFRVYVDYDLLLQCTDDDSYYRNGVIGFENIGGGHFHILEYSVTNI